MRNLALWVSLGALASAGIALTYCLLPRRASLREFEPAEVGRLETAMWREYYDHEYLAMLRSLYSLNRRQYRFSPWDSGRIAFLAALAAKRFQPSRSRPEAQRALPPLVKYYAVIRSGTGESFDPHRAAELELEWWQMRRENATPAEYGTVVARVFEEVYGVKSEQLNEAADLRAEAMGYRDERGEGRMGPADWERVEGMLTRAYALLRGVVGGDGGAPRIRPQPIP